MNVTSRDIYHQEPIDVPLRPVSPFSSTASYFNREFQIRYQPILQCGTTKVTGFASVLSLQQSNQILCSDEYVTLISHSGLTVPMRDWLLQEVSHQLASWQSQLINTVHPFINIYISDAQFSAPGLSKKIIHLSEHLGVNLTGLQLKINQQALSANIIQANQHVRTLKSLGVSIQLDHFYPSFAALELLRYFGITDVKVSEVYINDLIHDPELAQYGKQIFSTLVALKGAITVDGFQTAEQLAIINSISEPNWQMLCTMPMTAREATALLHVDDKSAQPNLVVYLSTMYKLSQLSQRFLGAKLVIKYWKETKPAADWLIDYDPKCFISLQQELDTPDMTLTSSQAAHLKLWIASFIKRSSLIIYDLPKMLLTSGDFSDAEQSLLP